MSDLDPLDYPSDDEAALPVLAGLSAEARAARAFDLMDADRVGLVRLAVERGVVDARTVDAMTGMPLAHLAAERDEVGLLRAMVLGKGADPNGGAAGWGTLLHQALHFKDNNGTAALFLINEAPGLDLGARAARGATALMMAAASGRLEVVEALVGKGVEVDAADDGGKTALVHALEKRREECAVRLLEAGASWRATVKRSENVKLSLLEAALEKQCTLIVKALVRRMRADGGEEGECVKVMGGAAEQAVYRRDLASLRTLVEEGLDVKAVRTLDDCGVFGNLLTLAARVGDLPIAAFLIELGFDPLAYDEEGYMPIHMAAFDGRTELIEWLLDDFSVPVDAENRTNFTALRLAAYRGHMETVQLLIERGADPLQLVAGTRLQLSQMAQNSGHTEVAAYLREQEAAAKAAKEVEAAARAEQEAVAEAVASADAAAAALLASLEEEAAREQAKKTRKQQKKKGRKGRQQQRQQEQQQGMGGAVAAGGAGGGGIGGMAAEDDFDDGAMDFGDLDAGDEEEPSAAAAAAVAGALAVLAIEQQAAAPAPAPAPVPTLPPPTTPRPPPFDDFVEADAPDHFLCPISFHLMLDPVVLFADGCTYSRTAIKAHLEHCRANGKPLTSPKTNLVIDDPADARFAPNVTVRALVLEFKEAKAREWEEQERPWREWEAAAGGGTA